MDRQWVRRTKLNKSERKLDRRASDAWHRLLAERGLGDEDVVIASSPLSSEDVSSPSVPPPMPPMTFTTKPMTPKCKSREDLIREKASKALENAKRRSKEPEYSSQRSKSFSNMRRSVSHSSIGSTEDPTMKESPNRKIGSQNKFIMSRSRGGKSSGALLSSYRWKDSPRTKHQRKASGENNFIVKFELLMKNKRSRWILSGQSSWTPRRFEIEGGVLKVFRKASTRAEETMLLSSCKIEALTAKNVKEKNSTTTNSTKDGMWSFKITSSIEDDRVVEVGSQDNRMLKQFHRLLKILSVSSQNFIPRHHIQYNDENVLGRGASGIVYKAQYFGTTVALKQLYDPSSRNGGGVPLGRLQQKDTSENESEESFLEEMVKELKLLSNFRHPNIISFLGVVFDAELAFKKNSLNRGRKMRKFETSSTSIVMEFCPYTLQDLIHDKKFQDLWSTERWIAAVNGIVRGMAFLHSKKVLHRDLKPENIMLSEGFEVKIVDFGVSKLYADRKKTMTGYVGTPCYMAPEFIKSEKNIHDGTSADVYSFAIILHQMWSREIPYNNIKQHFTIMRKVVNGYRMPMVLPSKKSISPGSQPKGRIIFPKALAELISRSWHANPEKRPSFSTIGRIWRDESIQEQIRSVETAWFRNTKSNIPEREVEVRKSKPQDSVKKKNTKISKTENSNTRTLRVKRSDNGEIGISFNRTLNIVAVSDWAKRFGLRVGQQIVECQGDPVSTGLDISKVIPKDRSQTIVLRVRVPSNIDEDEEEQGAVKNSSTTGGDGEPLLNDDVVQCKDGSLKLTRIQKDWFDENMRPEGIRRTTTKSLLMAMLVQLQA